MPLCGIAETLSDVESVRVVHKKYVKNLQIISELSSANKSDKKIKCTYQAKSVAW